MSITIDEGLEISKVLKEIKGSKVKHWISEKTHEDILVVDKDNNRYEIKYYPAKNADKHLD